MPVRYLVTSLIAALVFAVTGLIAGHSMQPAPYKSAEGMREWGIRQVKIDAVVTPQGEAKVVQDITADFRGQFQGFFQDLPYNKENSFSGLQAGDDQEAYAPGASAELGSSGAPGSWGYTYLSGRVLRVVWHHDSQGDKTFRLKYNISGVAESYQDADIVRMRPWGQFWEAGPRYLTVKIKLPPGKILSASASPKYIDAQASVRGQTVTFTASQLPAKQAASLLIKMAPGSIPGAKKKPGNAPSLKDTLGEKGFEAYGKNPQLRASAWAGALLLLVALPVLAWFLWWKRRLADAAWSSSGPQYDPPPGSLSYGYTVAQEQLLDISTALTATLIDLVARGFYTRENTLNDGGEWRLTIGIPQARPQQQLTVGEQATLNYFDGLLAAGPCQVDELSDRADNGESGQKAFSEVSDGLLEDMKQGDQKSSVAGIKMAAAAWVIAATPLAAALTFSLPYSRLFATMTLIGFGVTILILLSAVISWPRGDFTHSGDKAMQQAGPWRAYRDFILSFSSMETAPDLQVELWERAFAAALMFGVAEEFAARARILLPNLSNDAFALSYVSYSSASLGSSISSASSPSSSSSGAGGGFGGGGFGGGGGGAW